jgi:hypothetical protein
MDIPQWLKDIPPFVSAIVATLALLVSLANCLIVWRNSRRDRYDLKVELQWNADIVHQHGVRSPVQQRFARITVTNNGRRPVNVVYVGLELPGRVNPSANWLDESVKLGEADRFIVKVPQDSNFEPFLDKWKKIRATVETNSGHWYTSAAGSERPILIPGYDFASVSRLQDFTLLQAKNSTEPPARRDEERVKVERRN